MYYLYYLLYLDIILNSNLYIIYSIFTKVKGLIFQSNLIGLNFQFFSIIIHYFTYTFSSQYYYFVMNFK